MAVMLAWMVWALILVASALMCDMMTSVDKTLLTSDGKNEMKKNALLPVSSRVPVSHHPHSSESSSIQISSLD